SGIRRLGEDLMAELVERGSLEASILFTHVHLDHINGLPFFAPLFVPKEAYPVHLCMYGSVAWHTDLQGVLAAALSPPLFPVAVERLRQEAASFDYVPVYDRLTVPLGENGSVTARCRRLHHPNETYGWRIEFDNRVFVVATDTEPYAGPDPALAQLAEGA